MMGQLVRLPTNPAALDRLTDRQRIENVKAERTEAAQSNDAAETSLRIAMQHRDRWPDIIAGGVAFAFVAWIWIWGLMTLAAVL